MAIAWSSAISALGAEVLEPDVDGVSDCSCYFECFADKSCYLTCFLEQ
jgi:hypothetical protein